MAWVVTWTFPKSSSRLTSPGGQVSTTLRSTLTVTMLFLRWTRAPCWVT